MTLSQKEKYADVEELIKFLNLLKGKKFKLECGHHVTFGFYLGNDVVIRNGKELEITCLQCNY